MNMFTVRHSGQTCIEPCELPLLHPALCQRTNFVLSQMWTRTTVFRVYVANSKGLRGPDTDGTQT